MVRTSKSFCTAALAAVLALPTFGEPITVATEDNPPYSYSENGKVVGIATEIVEAVLSDLKNDSEIVMYPWARAYSMALTESNVLIFGMDRTPEREGLFKWVGLISSSKTVFFSLSGRKDLKLNHLDDAKKYLIGVIRKDSREQYLSSQGFVQLDNVTSDKQNLRMLMNGRIDLWITDELHGYYEIKKHGYKVEDFTAHMPLIFPEGIYLAFSKNTSDELVEIFRESLKNIKDSGVYDNIVAKYK
jgi:polar amino acid transport system substrate-binding protein